MDDELDQKTILRSNRTLENYLQVSTGDDVYNVKTITDKNL